MTRSGLLVVAVIGGLALLAIALGEVLYGVAPVYYRAAATATIRRQKAYEHDVAQRAGFAMPVADSETITVSYPDAVAAG